MAKLNRSQIIHSTDACTLILNGNPEHPEPTHVIVKFPGGEIEIARCSDGQSYWVHMMAGKEKGKIIGSRIEYDHEGYLRHGIPCIDQAHDIKRLAVQIKRDG